MKTNFSKMIAMLLCISFIFNFCIGGISAEGEKSINDKYTIVCFWQYRIQAFRNLIFQAPHTHYWDFMVECVSL